MNIKDNEYIEQNGCHNCKNCFIKTDYDSESEFYCNISKDRPKCGSVGMNERFNFRKSKINEYDTWNNWQENHRVEPWGICKNYLI
jgi:hypothetical protein